jgi:NAD(P)-dependent dehydrogenase (short-subunit alcohol dehydrogenase family)
VRGQSPFGRVATPQEVAQALCALAEPSAEWASGAVIDFNGASYLH